MKTILFFASSTRHSCKSRLDGVWRFADKAGWRVQVVERAFTHVNVRETLRFWDPSGVIAECGSGAEGMTHQAFGGRPVVYIDCDPKLCRGEMSVQSDAGEISRLAARELLALDLAHYAFVPFRLSRFWSVQRGGFFKSEIQSAGRAFSSFRWPVSNDADVRAAALEAWLKVLPKPCGIFAANDNVSEEVVNVAVQVGIRIPEDIAVLGVDNDEQVCENLRPKLSSIAPDFAGAGYLAARLLSKMMRSGKVERKIHYFKSELVVHRKSTQVSRTTALPARSAIVARALAFIRAARDGKVSVPEIVRILGYSRRTAEIRFRQETGKSILEMVNDHVFELACKQLSERHASAGIVATQLSVSRNTLDRIFKMRTGLSANGWRRMAKEAVRD